MIIYDHILEFIFGKLQFELPVYKVKSLCLRLAIASVDEPESGISYFLRLDYLTGNQKSGLTR